jgi:hypothetical protein
VTVLSVEGAVDPRIAVAPLLRMVRETPTDYRNDSCAIAQPDYAVPDVLIPDPDVGEASAA